MHRYLIFKEREYCVKDIAKLLGNKEYPNIITLSLWAGVFISNILYLIELSREAKCQNFFIFIFMSLQTIFKTFPENIDTIVSVSLALARISPVYMARQTWTDLIATVALSCYSIMTAQLGDNKLKQRKVHLRSQITQHVNNCTGIRTQESDLRLSASQHCISQPLDWVLYSCKAVVSTILPLCRQETQGKGRLDDLERDLSAAPHLCWRQWWYSKAWGWCPPVWFPVEPLWREGARS